MNTQLFKYLCFFFSTYQRFINDKDDEWCLNKRLLQPYLTGPEQQLMQIFYEQFEAVPTVWACNFWQLVMQNNLWLRNIHSKNVDTDLDQRPCHRQQKTDITSILHLICAELNGNIFLAQIIVQQYNTLDDFIVNAQHSWFYHIFDIFFQSSRRIDNGRNYYDNVLRHIPTMFAIQPDGQIMISYLDLCLAFRNDRRDSTFMLGFLERLDAMSSQNVSLIRSEITRPLPAIVTPFPAIAYIPSITTAANDENDEKDNQTKKPIVSDCHEDDDP